MSMRGFYGPLVKTGAAVFVAAGVVSGWMAFEGRFSVAGPGALIAKAPAGEDGAPAPQPHAGGEIARDASGAPLAPRADHVVTTPFGASRVDPWYWLREKENPNVLAYLEAENAFAATQLAPYKAMKDEIARTLEERARLEDAEPPYAMGGYLYQTRYAQGADYPVIVRRKDAGAPEEIVLDAPELAKGHAQYFLHDWTVSPDGGKVAFAVDFTGDRRGTVFVRDLATGRTEQTPIVNADGDLVWSAGGDAIYYAAMDQTYRASAIRRFDVTRGVDRAIVTEPDTTFSLQLTATKSGQMAIVVAYHAQRSEVQAISLADEAAPPVMLVPRSRDARATADHLDGAFYILTDDGAPDFRIVKAPDTAPAPENWSDVVPQIAGRTIQDFALFHGKIAVEDVHDARQTVRVVDVATGAAKEMSPDAVGVTTLDRNEDAGLKAVRLSFQTPTTPSITYDLDLESGAATEIHRAPAWSWHKPELYQSERIEALSSDGAHVPVTLVWRRDRKVEGGNPTLVYGYGAYGVPVAPGFVEGWTPLLDRGFVLAIAHVRGGADLGEAWYESGRMANKKNSFADFIAATEALIAKGYAKPGKIYAYGASAGGLLVGAVMNMRPELYDGVAAGVPFVDVLTTMLDDTIPLTTFEYEEWGDPRIPEQYDWMKAYSPYDNVTAKSYPALYVFTALNDSQVGYFEPAKWVAKLRATKTGDAPITLLTDMGAGHAGDSGRAGRAENRAGLIAWLAGRAARP